MKVECVKYIIWAKDVERAVKFYCDLFEGEVVHQSEAIAEVNVAGATIGIHSGGESEKTWTGMAFRVEDVVKGAAELKAAGGTVVREPEGTKEEPAHLAMCADPEGNEIMLTQKRG